MTWRSHHITKQEILLLEIWNNRLQVISNCLQPWNLSHKETTFVANVNKSNFFWWIRSQTAKKLRNLATKFLGFKILQSTLTIFTNFLPSKFHSKFWPQNLQLKTFPYFLRHLDSTSKILLTTGTAHFHQKHSLTCVLRILSWTIPSLSSSRVFSVVSCSRPIRLIFPLFCSFPCFLRGRG